MNQLLLKCLVSKQPVTWIVDHNYAGLSTRSFQRKALFIDHYKVTIVEFIIGVHVNSGFKSFSCNCKFYRSRLSLIIQVNVVLNKTVVVDSD